MLHWSTRKKYLRVADLILLVSSGFEGSESKKGDFCFVIGFSCKAFLYFVLRFKKLSAIHPMTFTVLRSV